MIDILVCFSPNSVNENSSAVFSVGEYYYLHKLQHTTSTITIFGVPPCCPNEKLTILKSTHLAHCSAVK